MENKQITVDDLPNLPLTELKALVYDLAAEVQKIQANVNVVNKEIAKRAESAPKLDAPPA